MGNPIHKQMKIPKFHQFGVTLFIWKTLSGGPYVYDVQIRHMSKQTGIFCKGKQRYCTLVTKNNMGSRFKVCHQRPPYNYDYGETLHTCDEPSNFKEHQYTSCCPKQWHCPCTIITACTPALNKSTHSC